MRPLDLPSVWMRQVFLPGLNQIFRSSRLVFTCLCWVFITWGGEHSNVSHQKTGSTWTWSNHLEVFLIEFVPEYDTSVSLKFVTERSKRQCQLSNFQQLRNVVKEFHLPILLQSDFILLHICFKTLPYKNLINCSNRFSLLIRKD